jgi:hypothetical protein
MQFELAAGQFAVFQVAFEWRSPHYLYRIASMVTDQHKNFDILRCPEFPQPRVLHKVSEKDPSILNQCNQLDMVKPSFQLTLNICFDSEENQP